MFLFYLLVVILSASMQIVTISVSQNKVSLYKLHLFIVRCTLFTQKCKETQRCTINPIARSTRWVPGCGSLRHPSRRYFNDPILSKFNWTSCRGQQWEKPHSWFVGFSIHPYLTILIRGNSATELCDVLFVNTRYLSKKVWKFHQVLTYNLI